MKLHPRFLLFPCVALVAACQPPAAMEEPAADEPVGPEIPPKVVYAGSYPLAFFAERLGGDAFEVVFPVPDDADPETWIPDDETAAALQSADLILLNGAGFEDWPDKVMLPGDRTVDTSAGFADRLMEVEDAVTHQHGPHGMHTHGGTASHVWLDPQLAAQQTLAVQEALAGLRPDLAESLATRGEELRAELAGLDRDWEQVLAGLQGEALWASHPVYHYLARRYGLDVHSVHWEPTEHPDEDEWRKFDRRFSQRPSAWMLWEDAPTAETAAELDGRNVGVLVINPNLEPPDEGDFLTVSRADLAAAREALDAARAADAPENPPAP